MKRPVVSLAAGFLIVVVCSSSASSLTLKWNIPLNETLEILRTAQVRYLVNDRAEKVFDERNIIDLNCYAIEGDEFKLKGTFSVYEKATSDRVFNLREQYPADFAIKPAGMYVVEKKYYMPNLRNIPSFPDKDIQKGEKWETNGELVINSFSAPFKMTFPVAYQLTEIENKDGKEIAIINFEYSITHNLAGGAYPKDFPLKILGKSQGVVRWDVSGARPVDIKEKYRILFFFRGEVRGYGVNEFQMQIDTRHRFFAKVPDREKEKARDELRKEIPRDVDVDLDKRGLILRFGEVLFDVDSHRLRPEAKKNLDIISEILKNKYPDREIIIEGHTDSTGPRRRNSRLSTERARSVAEYIRPRTGNDKMSYRGFGPDKPIGDNSTPEGRQKNRRVELIIKMH